MSKSRKRNVFIEHNVDQNTGEVTERRWITKQTIKTEKFIKYYAESLILIEWLTNGQYRILFELGKISEYNTNKVSLDKEKREEIAKSCQMASINQAISILTRSNILIKKSSTLYVINPRILFNGEETERLKMLDDNSGILGINKLVL